MFRNHLLLRLLSATSLGVGAACLPSALDEHGKNCSEIRLCSGKLVCVAGRCDDPPVLVLPPDSGEDGGKDAGTDAGTDAGFGVNVLKNPGFEIAGDWEATAAFYY